MMFASGRLKWWLINLSLFFVFLGIMVSGVLPASSGLLKMVAVIWMGFIAVHSIMMSMQGEKPKNKRKVRLSDDGELVEVSDTEDELSDGLVSNDERDEQSITSKRR